MLKFRLALKRHRLLKRRDTVVLAVSGGVDSMVMLALFNSIKKAMDLRLIVAHLNHNLRPGESGRDFAFVKKASVGLGLEFLGKTLKKGELARLKGVSKQAAARERRYMFLEDAAKRRGAGVVALAHNANDQAETMLMRFLSGSGLAGISGMPVKRGIYIRPLIDVTRSEIEAFAANSGIRFVSDSSNLTDDYLRNAIRHNLIPLIEKGYNPNLIETLGNASRVLYEDKTLLDALAEEGFSYALTREGRRFGLRFDRTRLSTLHPAIIARIFLKAVKAFAPLTAVYSAHALAFVEIVGSRKPNSSFTLPAGLCIKREYDAVSITKAEPPKDRVLFSSPLKVPGMTLLQSSNKVITAEIVERRKGRGLRHKDIKQGGLYRAYFDMGSAVLQLGVRSIAPGDRMMPFGMSGHRKLKDIFIDKKMPLAMRAGSLAITAGEDIVWVPGVLRSNLYRVRPETEKAVKLELKPTGGRKP